MNELKLLISRYVEDRESLSDDELKRLEHAVRTDRSAAALLKEQLMLDELLAQRFAIDRRNFPAQIEQRIRDHLQGTPGAIESAADLVDRQRTIDLRSRVSTEITRWQARDRRARIVRGAWIAATVVLAACLGVFSVAEWTRSRAIAVVDFVLGEPIVLRDDQSRPLAVGDLLYRGDRLQTGKKGLVTLHYEDDTTLCLNPGAHLEFADVLHSAKHVRLDAGGLTARVTPQTGGLPMRFFTPAAEAIVRGTELALQVQPHATRLDVAQGRVELKRPNEESAVIVRENEFGIASDETVLVQQAPWPVNREGLALLYETLEQPAFVADHRTGRRSGLTLAPRGDAGFDRYSAMRISAGALLAVDASEPLLSALQPAGELSLEITVQPEHLRFLEPVRVMTFSRSSQETNFALLQEADRLLLRLRTSRNDKSSKTDEIELCRLTDLLPHHVAVTYRSGQLRAYLDGRQILSTDKPRGDFRDWRRWPVLFGDESTGGGRWSGSIERVALFSRVLSADEIARNAAEQRQVRRQRLIESGLELRRLEVVARLVEKSHIPAAAEFAPNRDGLAVFKYRVVESVTGTLQPDDEIFVAHWVVLNARRQSVADRRLGDERLLAIDRIDRHPRLEGYARSDDFQQGRDAQAPRFIQIDDEVFPAD